MAIQASTVISTVRNLIPDPSGNLFADATLYAWLNEAVKLMAEGIGWQIEDWFPIAIAPIQTSYAIDGKWHAVTDAFHNRYQLSIRQESAMIWPSQSSGVNANWYSIHRQTDHLEITPFPQPSTQDVNTTNSANIAIADNNISLTSVTGFYAAGGFTQVESEIIRYSGINTSTNQLTGCLRGQSGTIAVAHTGSFPMYNMSLWVKGPRSPMEIAVSTDLIELLPVFVQPLQLYVLGNARRAEQEFAEARALMGEFNQAMQKIVNDPKWKTGNGSQIIPYGGAWQNDLVFGRVILN